MKRAHSSIRFLSVSAFSFGLNFGLTVIIREWLGAPAEVAFALAIATVFFTTFLLLRYYVYEGLAMSCWPQFLRFAGSTAAFRGSEYLAFLLLHTWLGADYRLAVLGILAVSTVLKYLWYSFLFESRSGPA